MLRNFVADGGASRILAIAKEGNVPLAETQKELTPLQRMVMELGLEKMSEEVDAQTGGTAGSGVSPTQNSLAGASGNSTMSGETVTYVNEGVGDGE